MTNVNNNHFFHLNRAEDIIASFKTELAESSLHTADVEIYTNLLRQALKRYKEILMGVK
jgi:hypothetical protein